MQSKINYVSIKVSHTAKNFIHWLIYPFVHNFSCVSALKSSPADSGNIPTPNIGFSKVTITITSMLIPKKKNQNIFSIQKFQNLQAMSGFIMMMTQQGKLLYISENAAEYLGHSMVRNELKVRLNKLND